MHIEPSTPRIGAEITDLDLREVSDADVVALRDALHEHLVLFFRDQTLDDAAQQRFAARLAEPEEFPFGPGGPPDAPNVHAITTGGEAPKTANADTWHSDATFMECPPMASMLRAVELPALGGDTLWASAYDAYDALSSRLQTLIEGMTATHSVAKSSAHRAPVHDRFPPVQHPVVRTHPVTGRRALFVNRIFTVALDGVSERENEVLLPLLCDTFQQPDLQVRLRWSPGTVALWDNRSTQHYATFDYSARREMHRILLRGDRPR
mgnify:CR=1 FL=1